MTSPGVDAKPNLSRSIEANRAALSDATGSRAPLQVQKYPGWIEDRRVSLYENTINLYKLGPPS